MSKGAVFLICICTTVSALGESVGQGHMDKDIREVPHDHKCEPLHEKLHPPIPEAFDWQKVEVDNTGKTEDFLTSSWNQHIPEYCGSCWLHGALSTVNDRFKILSKDTSVDVMLARQVILNCGEERGFGAGCDGGSAADVFGYMKEYGLPDETCQIYNAKSLTKCTKMGECMNCWSWPGKPSVCWPVKDYERYYVSGYNKITIDEEADLHPRIKLKRLHTAIMTEIYFRGPVVCSFTTSDNFDFNYTSGVWKLPGKEVDHDVEIVGWGDEIDSETGEKVPYWRVRNSWGTYWGEEGFFRVLRGGKALVVEDDCWYALPAFEHPKEAKPGLLFQHYQKVTGQKTQDEDQGQDQDLSTNSNGRGTPNKPPAWEVLGSGQCLSYEKKIHDLDQNQCQDEAKAQLASGILFYSYNLVLKHCTLSQYCDSIKSDPTHNHWTRYKYNRQFPTVKQQRSSFWKLLSGTAPDKAIANMTFWIAVFVLAASCAGYYFCILCAERSGYVSIREGSGIPKNGYDYGSTHIIHRDDVDPENADVLESLESMSADLDTTALD